ncbi:MAG: RrF2 family transcriptional regulator [Planctomycetota bacterium]|jgi:Rrf2 family protein
MNLSMAAELAIRGIRILALKSGERPVPLKVICGEGDLPKQYLVKIFAMLAKADLITPIRGKHGGYVLARKPEDITLLAVIEAVEGPLALNLCQYSPPKCEATECGLRKVWAELQETVQTKLGSVTLASVVACDDEDDSN